ncbi:MAG: AAA family ATPase [Bryobacterales bacterium]|nr:AAA family ATPase [Bryobacterales bacterium]
MLAQISVANFKSLGNIHQLDLPRLALFFGPGAAGKSNFFDAVQVLSRAGTARTLAESFQPPVRGRPAEAFSFPPDGLPAQARAEFRLGALLRIDNEPYEYRIAVRNQPEPGALCVADEYLAVLTSAGTPRGNPLIEQCEGELRIRRRSKPAHPRQEPLGLRHSLLSDPRLSGIEYGGIERCRDELRSWRFHELEPRAMRRAAMPARVDDIGFSGEDLAPYLHRLRTGHEAQFGDLIEVLRALDPGVEDLAVDFDPARPSLDVVVRRRGAICPVRLLSDATLRLLALAALAVNPWGGSLLALEEPENGLDPQGLERAADLLAALALERGRQVLITTHSPWLCAAVLRRHRERPDDIGVFRIGMGAQGTQIERFPDPGPLFAEREVLQSMGWSGSGDTPAGCGGPPDPVRTS